MPNTKKGHASKYGNSMVKVAPILCAVKSAPQNLRDINERRNAWPYHDRNASVYLHRQLRASMYVLELNKGIHPARTHSTTWPFSKYIQYNNGTFSSKMKIALEVIVKLSDTFSS